MSRPLSHSVVSMIAAAVLGSALVVGILFATGAVHAGAHDATIVNQGPRLVPTATRTSTGLSAPAIYSNTAAGVVDITSNGVSTDSSGGGGGGQSPFPFGGPSQPQQATATGTGFVIDSQGHILTAAHVVDGASSVTVTFQNGKTVNAKTDGEDKSSDVAVLSVPTSGLTLSPLSLGNSSNLVVGDALAAIGDPFGYHRSLSTGVVSGLDRTITAPSGFTIPHAIQTDAALNPGNSGGPVLNASGQVIGIADQIATGGSGQNGSAANTGVGFAVPIDIAKAELSKIEQGSSVQHAYLGIAGGQATGTQSGALVASVTSGSAAAKAGIHAGDVIVRIDSTPVTNVNDVINVISAHKPGDQVKITIKRGSGQQTVTATLGTQPAQAPTG